MIFMAVATNTIYGAVGLVTNLIKCIRVNIVLKVSALCCALCCTLECHILVLLFEEFLPMLLQQVQPGTVLSLCNVKAFIL